MSSNPIDSFEANFGKSFEEFLGDYFRRLEFHHSGLDDANERDIRNVTRHHLEPLWNFAREVHFEKERLSRELADSVRDQVFYVREEDR